MGKQPKNSLSEALKQSEGALHATPETPEPEPEPKPTPSENGKPRKTPLTRQDTKVIMGHFPKKVYKQLQYLRIETDKDIQKLLADALNLLFVKHDKPPIA